MDYHDDSKVKRFIKLIISMGFYFCTSAKEVILWLARRKSAATCVVLHYHGIAPEYRALFARQMDILSRLTAPIASDNQNPLQPGKRYAAVTFDDGFLNVAENAVPELVRTKIPATIFVVADLLGASATWGTLGSDCIAEERLISAEQLTGLPADLILIGSHTLSHPWLPSISEEQARIEVAASRDKLGKLLNREIRLFSFPYGALNDRLIDLCRDAGYERVFTILPRLAFADPREFVTGRVIVEPTDWVLEFRLKLLGAYRWLPSAFALKQMLFSFLPIKQKAAYAPEENRLMRTREWL